MTAQGKHQRRDLKRNASHSTAEEHKWHWRASHLTFFRGAGRLDTSWKKEDMRSRTCFSGCGPFRVSPIWHLSSTIQKEIIWSIIDESHSPRVSSNIVAWTPSGSLSLVNRCYITLESCLAEPQGFKKKKGKQNPKNVESLFGVSTEALLGWSNEASPHPTPAPWQWFEWRPEHQRIQSTSHTHTHTHTPLNVPFFIWVKTY